MLKGEKKSMPLNKPLFVYYAKPELFVSGMAFAIVFVAAIYGVLSDEVGMLGIVWVGLIDLIFLYQVVVRWPLPYWTVEFYDDKIVAKKLGSKAQMNYASIKNVQLSKSIWWGSRISIHSGTLNKPITVLKNPKDSKLKTDLYSWLLTKKSG